MSKKQKITTTEKTYTQVIPVVFCSDEGAVKTLMGMAGTVKAQTYNKFGSLAGWGISPMASHTHTGIVAQRPPLPTDL